MLCGNRPLVNITELRSRISNSVLRSNNEAVYHFTTIGVLTRKVEWDNRFTYKLICFAISVHSAEIAFSALSQNSTFKFIEFKLIALNDFSSVLRFFSFSFFRVRFSRGANADMLQE